MQSVAGRVALKTVAASRSDVGLIARALMPRFFFNVRMRPHLVEDHEGTELPDLDAARRDAILDAREAMSGAILDGHDISHRTVEICDDGGHVLLVVPYTDAILPN